MTIHEFAKTIGVSPTTVSRAMHGRGRVSPKTRLMVLERMRELGYTPNLNAQRLSHGRTYMVALDFGAWHDYLSDMFFVELTRGVQDALETYGYGVLLSGAGAVLNRWVKTQAVDGVILMGDPTDKTLPAEIGRSSTPCVVIGNHAVESAPCVGSVVVSLERGAREVANLLVGQGHRHIGFIATDGLDDVYYEFHDALKRFGVALAESCVLEAGHASADGARALTELLAQQEPPTAVFARTDALAFGALRAASRVGVRVPDDLSIVGHDDVSFADLAHPPLTTVRVNCTELACLATETLFDLLNEPNTPPQRKMVHTELVLRESVSAPRQWALSLGGPAPSVTSAAADGQASVEGLAPFYREGN